MQSVSRVLNLKQKVARLRWFLRVCKLPTSSSINGWTDFEVRNVVTFGFIFKLTLISMIYVAIDFFSLLYTYN